MEFYYSETGTIPIDIRISMRRLLYWWHILSVEKNERIHKVYTAPVSGDWIQLLQKDKQMFQIDMSDSEVTGISQHIFKKYVKKRAEELTINCLVNLKMKHSKSDQLDVKDLLMSSYLTDKRFSREERELLFRLR